MSCICSVLHLTWPESIMSYIWPELLWPVLHLTCPASDLSCICPVLHLTCTEVVLFCFWPFLHLTCPTSALSCIRPVLSNKLFSFSQNKVLRKWKLFIVAVFTVHSMFPVFYEDFCERGKHVHSFVVFIFAIIWRRNNIFVSPYSLTSKNNFVCYASTSPSPLPMHELGADQANLLLIV